MLTRYEIRVQGVLDAKWQAYFAPLIVTSTPDETVLTGTLHDQAELFGILLKIRDLGLHLVAVTNIPTGDKPQHNPGCH